MHIMHQSFKMPSGVLRKDGLGEPPALRRVGQGLITLKLSAEGEMRVVKSIQDVIRLWKEGADGKIVLVEDAGTTTLAPVLPKAGRCGVYIRSARLASHYCHT